MRVLFVVAHLDDEILGAGATINKLARRQVDELTRPCGNNPRQLANRILINLPTRNSFTFPINI